MSFGVNSSATSGVETHDLSGFLPSISPFGIEIPTYYLVISMTLVLCMFWMLRRTRARHMNTVNGLDLAIILMVAGFLGSRLFHVLLEEPRYYAARPTRVFEFWRGGFVWYGGAILGAAAAYAYMRVKRLKMTNWLDLYAPVVSLGYMMGRVACLLTGCCFGEVCVLPQALGETFFHEESAHLRHPTQIYAILAELVTLLVLLGLEKKSVKLRPGLLFSIWLILHSLGRIVMELFRADPRGAEPLGLSLATWISMALILASLSFILATYARQRASD